MAIPDGITREHVEEALKEIDAEGIPEKYHARTTFLAVGNKKYPVKYVIRKAADKAGIQVGEYNTVQAANYLKKLGFRVIKEKWELGIKIVEDAVQRFMEYAKQQGISVSEEQLGTFSKGTTSIYRQLALPKDLRQYLPKKDTIHFEWLVRPKDEEESAVFSLGLHLEFPREKKQLNVEIADSLLNFVDLKALSEKIGTEIKRENKSIYVWIMGQRNSLDPETEKEELVEWMANAMVEFYKAFLPALEEVLPRVVEMTRDFDINKLREIVAVLRDRYHAEWEAQKDTVFEIFSDVKALLLKLDALSPEETERIRMLLSKIPISYLFDWSVSTDYSFLNNPLLRGENGILRVASEITTLEDLNKKAENLIEIMRKIADDQKLRGFGTAVAASWMAVISPEVFMPTNARTVGKIQEVLGIPRFWGGNWKNMLDDFIHFLRSANLVKSQLGIGSMIELAFYMSKYKSQHRYWIELANPPTLDYIGKFIWAPYAPRWRQVEEVQEGDIVYHYITSRGPSNYRGTFVGKSRIKRPAQVIPKEKLKELIHKTISREWTEIYAEFTSRWFSQYDHFYLVELEAFEPFDPPLPREKVGFNPPQSYFTEASEEVVKKLEGPDEEPPIFRKLDTLLERKGQVILYGPPGTGKTWLAKEYLKKKVPGGKHIIPSGTLKLRDDINYYILVMSTAKYDVSKIREGLEETFSGKMKSAFESLEEGDIAFVYVTQPIKRIYAIAKCTGNYEESAKFKVLKLINGPSYEELKAEEPLKDSMAVRIQLRGTLFPLSQEEANWIASKIGLNELQKLGLTEYSESREYNAVEFVTFHPAFSYEDFVEGIKPETFEDPNTGKKELLFKVEEGVFKRIARNAYNALLNWAGISKEWSEKYGMPKLTLEEVHLVRSKIKSAAETMPRFYLIIDEINRGDIAKIFGELITLLEKDKRLFMEHETLTTLPYSKKKFGVPPNLYIIGTMNTSDRSIALIDVALRRRFSFVELMPDYEVLNHEIIERADGNIKRLAGIAVSALKILNKRITMEYDRDHQIGHAYYMSLKHHLNREEEFLGELKRIWFYEILPLLQEYFYDAPDKLRAVLRTKNPAFSFLEVTDGEIVGFKDENNTDNQKFVEMLQALIAGQRE